MQQYELLCVLPGTLSEEEAVAAAKKVTDVMEKVGVTVLSEDDMGKSRLAYPMKHIRYGYFRNIRLEAEPAAVVELQAQLRLLPELLRALISKFDPEAAKKDDARKARISSRKAQTKSAEVTKTEEAAPEPKKEEKKEEKVEGETKAEETPVKAEDIDKKLDELIDKDLTAEL